jgi:YesN/AraC family two-component response regulator
MLVKSELEKLGIKYNSVKLGEVNLSEDISDEQRKKLKENLLQSGLILLDNKNAMLIEKIKCVVIEMVHYADKLPKTNFSDYLTKQLKYDYTYMANLFSEIEGSTIEHYILVHKIEKVKELIIYDELNFSEIALKLNYSSVSHLSHQFKKITGLTPTFFKSLKIRKRNSLENL